MTTWNRFWRLSGGARRVVIESSAALTVTYLGLRLAGFRKWKAALAKLAEAPAGRANAADRDELSFAREIARLEQAAARHLFVRTNCLERSLVLWWLLERRGVAAELKVGARKEEGRFEAHAWVEACGAVLNDPDETHRDFVPFEGSIASMETQTH